MRIRSRGVLDRTVRLLVSDWGWPGVVLVTGGLLSFLLVPSTQWLDYRGVSDEMERLSALGVAVVGLFWILRAAAYARIHDRDRRDPRRCSVGQRPGVSHVRDPLSRTVLLLRKLAEVWRKFGRFQLGNAPEALPVPPERSDLPPVVGVRG